MTTASHRWLAVLLVAVVLAGCQGLPFAQKGSSTTKASLTETESFAQGLDQYMANGDLQTLKRLPQEYPDGAWGPRAELVVRLAEQQEQCVAGKEQTTGAKADKQKQQDLRKDKELSRCQNEMAALRQNNQELEETIAQLKKLLIDMESRSK